MRTAYFLPAVLLALFSSVHVFAQAIHGQVVDMQGGATLQDVSIHNVHTDKSAASDKGGNFAIDAAEGQLVEFRKAGYRTQRIRLPKGNLPVFKVYLEKGTDGPIMQSEYGAAPTAREDSLKYAALYKKELEFPRLKGYQAIQHPFSALSKKNQQIWAFQQEFDFYQQQKYIDYTFNAPLVTSLTGLTGDSLQTYMQMFRPTYQQLRTLGEYNFYSYIKHTVTLYRRRGIRARFPLERSSQ